MGILTLPSMFALACLLCVKKNIAGFKSHSDIHNYPTRNNNNIYMKIYKYSTIQNSFENVSVNLYNKLPPNLKRLSYSTHRVVRDQLVRNLIYNIE